MPIIDRIELLKPKAFYSFNSIRSEQLAVPKHHDTVEQFHEYYPVLQ